MNFLQFANKVVPYETFLMDIASIVVHQLKEDSADPEYISQRKAFQIFGRRNVERWRKLNLITAIQRPGKIEYKTSDLRLLQRRPQDYFNETDMQP